MIGGLLRTTSLAAIAAVTLAIGGSMTPASAADLGGNCCADLEERIAELEATTVRKGNRKVSVTLSGFVAHNVMWWDDGDQSDVYIADGGNYGSRFRFRGDAKISPTLSAGFLYEFQVQENALGNLNQFTDDAGGVEVNLRDSTVWMRHSQFGMLKLGQGSTATDNLILIDLGGVAGAATADYALYNGSFRFRGTGGGLGDEGRIWQNAIRGHDSFDSARRNHVLYETPALHGFTLQAALAEDNFWDVALRYAGEHHGFRLAFGIGYLEDTDFNDDDIDDAALPPIGVVCVDLCDTKSAELKGSASVLHVATGLFLTGAAGSRELDGDVPSTAGVDEAWFWYLSGGVRRNWFGYGDTVLFGEYSEAYDFLQQAAFFDPAAFEDVGAIPPGASTTVTYWGLGVNQYIDAAAMEVFLAYKHYELDSDGPNQAQDFDAVIGGARVNF